jgi:hypothetical protein
LFPFFAPCPSPVSSSSPLGCRPRAITAQKAFLAVTISGNIPKFFNQFRMLTIANELPRTAVCIFILHPTTTLDLRKITDLDIGPEQVNMPIPEYGFITVFLPIPGCHLKPSLYIYVRNFRAGLALLDFALEWIRKSDQVLDI